MDPIGDRAHWEFIHLSLLEFLKELSHDPFSQADVFAGGDNPFHDRIRNIWTREEFREKRWRMNREHNESSWEVDKAQLSLPSIPWSG